jgi:hypothetical protein
MVTPTIFGERDFVLIAFVRQARNQRGGVEVARDQRSIFTVSTTCACCCARAGATCRMDLALVGKYAKALLLKQQNRRQAMAG